MSRGKLGIMICNSGKHFAQKVVLELNKLIQETSNEGILKSTKEVIFANGEVKIEILESIRDQDIYIFQDVQNNELGLSINDNYMILKTAIQAAKMANARNITAVIPYYPYGRQDKPKTREGVTASMVARELEDVGANKIITLDLHNDAISGFFRKATLENLRASMQIINYIKENMDIGNLTIVSPDAGGAERANFYAKSLGLSLAMLHKERDYSKPNVVEKMSLLGDINGKNVFIIDDILDTAGTLINAIKKLKEEGAKEIYFGASHALLNGPAVERLNDAYMKKLINGVIATNTIFHSEEFKINSPWYKEVNMGFYFASIIYAINQGKSISELLK
jgi:ribose-phosphate pyrophosphokinase